MHAHEQVPADVTCVGCGRGVTLEVQQLTRAEIAWRWFDCPYCRKPNFLRLAGQILRVVAHQQES